MFKVSTDIKITKGFKRDLLLDLGRRKATIIDKDITKFLEEIEVSDDVEKDENSQLVRQLLDEEIIFELDSDESMLFPELRTEWQFPASITNAILELNSESLVTLKQTLSQLESLNCFYFSLILIEEFNSKQYELLYDILTENSIMNVDLALNFYKSNILKEFLFRILKTTLVKNRVVIFNCSDTFYLNELGDHFLYRSGDYSPNQCGCIQRENFHLNRIMYNESLSHNTCLNRKISIDRLGNIRNCPAMSHCYGNINSTKIEEVISQPKFTELWDITKNEILVCKDCEYRNICIDCRAFLEDPNDVYSKPLKCGYNPYNNIWEHWSLSPLKQVAINFYGFSEENRGVYG